MNHKALHHADGVALLRDRKPHTLRLWKISTGDVLVYKDVRLLGEWHRGGTLRVIFPNGQIRELRTVTLFCIDDIYLYL